jgi:hypothetical protein
MAKKKIKKVIKKTSRKKTKTKARPRSAKKNSLPKGQRIVVKEIVEETQIASSQTDSNFSLPKISDSVVAFDIETTSFLPFENNDEDEQLPEGEGFLLVEDMTPQGDSSGLTQKQKNIIMYTSIVTIMAVVVVFWIFAIRGSLSQNLQLLPLENINSDGRIGQKWEDVKAGMDNLKNSIGQQSQAISAFTNDVKTQIVAGVIKKAAASKIKTQLENLNVNATNLNQTLNTNSVQ